MGLIYRDDVVCLFCKGLGEKKLDYLCKDCFDSLNFNSGYHDIRGYEFVYSVLDYDRALKSHLFAYKYDFSTYYYKVFGEIILYDILREGLFKDIDYILAVPLHRRKRAFRGYNQSDLLVDYIGERLKLARPKDLLYKTRHTKDQHNLNSLERKKNLRSAFSIREGKRILDKNILVVDDVLTTGTTMERVGVELSRFKPKGLYGLTLSTAAKKS